MNPIKIVKLVSHVTRPRSILRVGLWWDPRHLKTAAGYAKGRRMLLESGEAPTETLLDGELSDGLMKVQRASRKHQPIPKGFLAVYVGPERRRFVIPTSFLSMSEFRALMDRVAEEFGFEQEGGLQIPCEEQDFEEILMSCFRMQKLMCNERTK